MNQTIEWKKTQAGSTEAVQFSDGMLVTAEDLGAAMRYPFSVVQVLLRAFFGCGVVCGLDIRAATPPQAEQRDAAGKIVSARPADCDADYGLIIEKGVALGCDGYPIELCGPLKLDLTRDPCRLDRGDKVMFIAIRRVTASEASARPCGCGSGGDAPGQQCTRVRDHILVQAFDQEHLPKELCRAAEAKAADGKPTQNANAPAPTPTPAAGTQPQDAARSVCDCLKQCGECACCGDQWVLLGTVTVTDNGLEAIQQDGYRRYVKPVACICAAARSDAAAAPSGHGGYATDVPAKPVAEAQTAPDAAPKTADGAPAAPDAAPKQGGEALPAPDAAPKPADGAQPAPDAAPKQAAEPQPAPDAAPKQAAEPQPAPDAAPKQAAESQPAPDAAPKQAAEPQPAAAPSPAGDGQGAPTT